MPLAFFAAAGIPCLIFPCFGIVGILLTIFWLWMLIEAITKEPSDASTEKIVWIVVIIFLHGLGALLYFLIRRPERIRKYGN